MFLSRLLAVKTPATIVPRVRRSLPSDRLGSCSARVAQGELLRFGEEPRTDGQRIGGIVALQQKIEIDKTICRGETQKAGLAGQQQIYGTLTTQIIAAQAREQQLNDVAKGCMAERGYLRVPLAEAEARAEAFSSTKATVASADKHMPG